ncbi:chorismate mutase [Bacillus sp. Y1]|nr:chorismate mutase [Bacillus sp. Y1]AYA76835.1 chorismate mutase [Bacillus sp. Y1]
MIRGVRGAITVQENKEEEIIASTKRLLEEMIQANRISPDSVASVFISVTDDVTATFPAKAMRQLEGWTYVPVMCMKEISVPTGIKLCIRVMMHVNTEVAQTDIEHVYLEEAVLLRPDLKK